MAMTQAVAPESPVAAEPSRPSGAAAWLGSLLSTLGEFYSMCAQTARQSVRMPFQKREFIDQAWFVASVSLVPTLLVAIPFCVIVVFQINQLLAELGAVDLAGAGAGLTVVREIGPLVSVLVVAGAGATAMCADLGSRTIREEIDALRVLGIDPIYRLVVPRVAASTVVALSLNGIVTFAGLSGGYIFSVFVQDAGPGLFVANLNLLVGLADFLTSLLKAAVFGMCAGLVACFIGLNAKGGPKGVGDAVNQTVVFSFMLLFFANSIITSVFIQFYG